MDTAHFQIAAQPVGGRIHINGTDVTGKVGAVEMRLGEAEVTVVTLHLLAGAEGSTIEGRGVVQVVAEGGGRTQVIEEFLATVDPAELEKAAQYRTDLGGTLTQKMLTVLGDWANAPDSP